MTDETGIEEWLRGTVVPWADEWESPGKQNVLLFLSNLDALREEVAELKAFRDSVPWGPISAEHQAMETLLVDDEDRRLWAGVERWLVRNKILTEEIMGIVKGVSHAEWPRQSEHVGKSTRVTFNYDVSRQLRGTIVRDDLSEPWETIIALGDGRYVRGVECQYSPWDVPQE